MKAQNGALHLLKTAFIDFRRNKVRTFLTSLGITIGVLSVVMLIALGLGLKNYLKQQFESLGANMILIMPGSGFSGEGGGFAGAFSGLSGGADFDEKDLAKLRRISGVDYAVPQFFKSTLIEASGEKEFGYIEGVNTDAFKVLNLEPESGEFWTKSDTASRAKVGILGFSMAEKLFDTPDEAVGKIVRFSDLRFRVVGVAKKKGDNEMDNAVIIPYKSTYGSLNPDKTFFTLFLGVNDEDDVPFVKDRAEEILLRRYKDEDFSVTEQSELLSTINQIFNIVNGVLVAIGSISLLVGGIGIMNIMYASVTERTKEVGIRRAVGATERDILMQFLTESLVLSIMGGAMGLFLSSLIVLAVRPFFPVAINALAVIITITISSSIGIFFGVFPARRAAKLPPIEAIRYE